MTNYKIEWLRANGRRYLVWLAVATAFAIACWFLSQWQLSRLDEVRNANSLITRNYDQAPVSLRDLAEPENFDTENSYRRVVLKGVYASGGSVLIRNRPLNGQPGFEQFAPFLTAEGDLVYVDRGWYPTGNKQDLPDQMQSLDSGCQPIEIIAHVRSAEPDSKRDYPSGQVGKASPQEAARNAKVQFDPNCGLAKVTYLSVYLSLESETPALAGANPPAANQRPQLSEGNHLSYAMQWVLFALMAFIALFYMVRQELLLKREQSDKSFKRKARKQIGQTDADYEDQLSE